jgi:hypothetical protein
MGFIQPIKDLTRTQRLSKRELPHLPALTGTSVFSGIWSQMGTWLFLDPTWIKWKHGSSWILPGSNGNMALLGSFLDQMETWLFLDPTPANFPISLFSGEHEYTCLL